MTWLVCLAATSTSLYQSRVRNTIIIIIIIIISEEVCTADASDSGLGSAEQFEGGQFTSPNGHRSELTVRVRVKVGVSTD